MGSVWLLIYLVAAGIAVVQGVLIIAQIWEHRRFVRGRFRRLLKKGRSGRAMLLIPCRGTDLGLERNLDTLLQQDYEDYQVRFIVESEADPAYAAIQRVIGRRADVRCEVIVAGQASCGGQKVHNLRMATAELPAEVEYLAFVDSDARLEPCWLRALVGKLDHDDIAAATGYRWFVPTRGSLANWLLESINANYALSFGPKTPGFIWGGSWAIRRKLFESLDLRGAWEGTLSDDLVATRVVNRSGLRSVFEPRCMVGSPLDTNLRDMFSFLRRQYLISRYYAAPWWAMALVVVLFADVVFWGSAGWAVWARMAGRGEWWIPAAVAASLYAISVLRGQIRSSIARLYFPDADDVFRRVCRFDAWAGPLAGLVNGAALVSSAVGRHLVWRGITYRLHVGGRAEPLRRDEPGGDRRDETEHGRPARAGVRKPHMLDVAPAMESVAKRASTGTRQSP